jgi:hypothetical protein
VKFRIPILSLLVYLSASFVLQLINQWINQWINQSNIQSVKHPSNQSINQAIKQSIKQSINISFFFPLFLVCFFRLSFFFVLHIISLMSYGFCFLTILCCCSSTGFSVHYCLIIHFEYDLNNISNVHQRLPATCWLMKDWNVLLSKRRLWMSELTHCIH